MRGHGEYSTNHGEGGVLDELVTGLLPEEVWQDKLRSRYAPLPGIIVLIIISTFLTSHCGCIDHRRILGSREERSDHTYSQ